MRFITLSSSSAGNGYLLRASSGEVLIIEAGVKLSQIKKALDFDMSRIQGCIISHSHNDHSKYLREYLEAGIRCYINEDTAKTHLNGNRQGNRQGSFRVLKEKDCKEIGDFLIKPFLLEHDVQNFGYLIHHHESGLICFITDTNYCHYTFKGLNNILVEANYSNEIIDRNLLDGTANLYLRNRILTYHMEFETTKAFLRANNLSKVNNIVLIHLSMDNSNLKQFRNEVTELTGKQVFIAQQGLDIELNMNGV